MNLLARSAFAGFRAHAISLRGVLLLGLFVGGGAWAQNDAFEFTPSGDQIRVEDESHWRNWIYQNNLVRDVSSPIDSSGLFTFSGLGTKPIYLTDIKNYVLDAGDFEYLNPLPGGALTTGGITALSRTEWASRVGDRDPTTFWQPADSDFDSEGLRNWQVLVDLGRTVFADSIVVVLPPIAAGGEEAVPLIPDDVESLSDLSADLEASVRRLARRTTVDSLLAPTDLVTDAGDTLVTAGDVLLSPGQRLPLNVDVLRQYNQLGITDIAVAAEEDLGDAPKLFTVEASMGKQAGDSSSKNFRFGIVGRASVAGNQRRFVFPLEPLDGADSDQDGSPDFAGSFIHFVRLTIFDSDFQQKEFLGVGEEGMARYEELDDERRGLRIFQRLTAGGFVKRINPILDDSGGVIQSVEEIYEGLSEDERGPIRYFVRELPRVSEIEVWGRGPNLAYRPERHAGAGFEDGGKGTPMYSVDGVYLTRWMGNAWDLKYSTGFAGHDQLVCCTMWLDLGASFWVDTIYLGMVTTRETSTEGAVFGWHLLGSDGTALRALDLQTEEDFTQLEFGLSWTDMVSEVHKDNNTARARMMKEEFSLRKLRFFQQRNDDPTGARSGAYSAQGHFNELQLYGRGYPAEVALTSPAIILLPGVREEDAGTVKQRSVLSQIRWDAEAVVHRRDPVTGQSVEFAEPLELHPEVDMRIQTRTSDDIDSLFAYYKVTGKGTLSESRSEVDVTEYTALMDLWDVYRAWDALPAEDPIRLQFHRTGRDDDGDRRTDEDPVDGIDNDGDKIIDEDGLTGEEGGPTSIRGAGTITLLKHMRKQDDDGDGAQDEDAIDGIDNDGDFLIDEDGKKKSKPRQEADVTITPVFAGWSAWSEPYKPTEGEYRAVVTSPSPRKFLQIQVTIVSSDPEASARIKSIAVDIAPPISTDLAGELAVRQGEGETRPVDDLLPVPSDYDAPVEIPPLNDQPFSYFLRAAGPDPNAPEAAAGFDEILLMTPTQANLRGVRVGTVEIEDIAGSESVADRRADETTFTRAFTTSQGDDLFRDAEGALLDVLSNEDSLLVRFPSSVNATFGEFDNAIVELQFDTRTLKAGTEFLAMIRSSTDAEGVFLRVEAEGRDATELVDSRTARPVLAPSGAVIDEITVPAVFTPNGDNINDVLNVEFTILRLRQDRPVEVSLYDLAGRRLARALPASGEAQAQSGLARFTWDGTVEGGDLVPPGTYLCRIQLQADAEDIEVTRVVSVVY